MVESAMSWVDAQRSGVQRPETDGVRGHLFFNARSEGGQLRVAAAKQKAVRAHGATSEARSWLTGLRLWRDCGPEACPRLIPSHG